MILFNLLGISQLLMSTAQAVPNYTETKTITFKFKGVSRVAKVPIPAYERCSEKVKYQTTLCGQVFNLEGANADFSGKDLRGMTWVNSDLTQANFNGANMRGGYFIHINRKYEQANMRITGANFENADLEDANITGGGMVVSGINFKNSNLNFAEINFAEVDQSDFSFAKMNSTKLNQGTYKNNRYQGAQLSKAILSDSRFFDSNFSGNSDSPTNITHAYLSDSKFIRCDFRFVNLNHADLRGTKIQDSNFDETTNIRGAIFDQYSQLPLSDEELLNRGAIFMETILE